MSTFFLPRFRLHRMLRLAAPAMLAGLAMMALPLSGARAEITHLTVARASGASQHISVGLNKSMIIDLPADAREVIVSQPTIAAVTMRSKRRGIVQGIGMGDTNIFFLDARGAQIATFEVSIVKDAGALNTALAQIIPHSNITVQNFGDHVVLSGSVLSQDDSDRASQVAGQFVADPKFVANLLTVTGAQQVMLKVTVAEISREAIKQLGMDLNASVSGGLVTNLVNTPVEGGISGAAPTGTLTASATVGPLSIDATLHALERRNAARTLAEPTLTAMSGQPAEFLVGGELPYTTIDKDGNPTTLFKDYGVQLNFTPTVKSNGQILLNVDTEVSEPVSGGALTKRSAKTTVELPPRQTLAIGGLIQDKLKQEINSIPGIGNIPILGALFRSRDFIHDQTELVILVTPYMSSPGPMPGLPTDDAVPAGDAEAIFLGHMQKLYGVGDPNGPAGQYQGSVGFALD